jgi:multisubunit Na+/H+ antiporter MnhB subunit
MPNRTLVALVAAAVTAGAVAVAFPAHAAPDGGPFRLTLRSN